MKRCDEYRELRRRIGTQEEVAPLIGVTTNALSDREMGHTEIRQEAFLALHLLLIMRENAGKRPIPGIRSI